MTNLTEYNLIKLDELYSQPLEVDWLIEDIIPSDSIGMIYGASGCGKSHIILSMAAMMANGSPWFDKDTKQGSVLVMAGEGLKGIARRLKAIEKEHDLTIDQANLRISDRAIGLDTDQGCQVVEQAIKELETPPQLIFIDTLSRHLMESEENNNDHMTRFINRLEEIRRKYECTIVLVHHTGKSTSKGARGASAIKASIDFSFEVEGKDKICSFSCDKMKDADDDISVKRFQIKGVDLGQMSKKGKPITGACVVKTDKVLSLKVSGSSNEEVALECFNPERKVWQQSFVNACTDDAKTESKEKRFRATVKDLVATGVVKDDGGGACSIIQAA